MTRPNFFIPGAPKSGTTSMYHYLRQHPQIYMSRVKEPQFFSTDLEMAEGRRICDLDAYLSLFQNAQDAKRIGEASVWNLFSRDAAQNIKAFDPEAKIIIMLRHPADLIYSLHGQFIYSMNEDILDFEAALAAEPDRQAGRRIPHDALNPQALCYRKVAQYGEQVQRYVDAFGRENVQVILFEDFAGNTAQVYRRTLEFLGVDPGFTPNLEPYNVAANKTLRHLAIRRLLKRHAWLKRMISNLLPRPVREAVENTLAKLTGSKVKRSAKIPDRLRQELVDDLRPDVRQLSELLEIDLSHWYS